MNPPPRGPPCARCGCTWVEHEKHVDDDWRRVAGQCLSCSDCEEFTCAAGEEGREWSTATSTSA